MPIMLPLLRVTGLDNQVNVLYGEWGDDTLIGGAGNDVLGGAADSLDATRSTRVGNAWLGNDYTGGTGNDTLRGTFGDDTYHHAMGDGADILVERGGSHDKIVLEGINHDQLWFERSGNDLFMSVIGAEEQVAIQDWYLAQSNQIEAIHSSDSMDLINTNLDQLVAAMAAFTKPSMGDMTLPVDVQDALQPVISAVWQTA